MGSEEAHILAGLVGKKIKHGLPAGYTEATVRVNFQLPANITDAHHVSTQPEAAWFLYKETNGANYNMATVDGVEIMPTWLKYAGRIGNVPENWYRVPAINSKQNHDCW
jgi:beta-galactosidase GanA